LRERRFPVPKAVQKAPDDGKWDAGGEEREEEN
jgi:hypothetical protein